MESKVMWLWITVWICILVFNAIDGVAIKFQCREDEIHNFKIRIDK